MKSLNKYLLIGLQFSFWSMFLIYSLKYTSKHVGETMGIWLSALCVLHLLGIAFLNTKVLFHHLFISKRYIWYILSIVFVIIVSVYLNKKIMFLAIEFSNQVNEVGKGNNGIFTLHPKHTIFTLFVIVCTVLVSTIHVFIKDSILKERERLKLKNEHLFSEVKFLKTQIQPHFLLNALNNIHSAYILNKDNTEKLILALGDMLKYVLYDCSKTKVLLVKEKEYIEHYLVFQRNKDGRMKNVSFDSNLNDHHIEIEPMLLIPFVENAFKHNIDWTLNDFYVKIELFSTNDKLIFRIENSKSKQKRTSSEELIENSGIGINNVQTRLELLYKNKYTLKIKDELNFYQVDLTLNL